MRGGDKDNILKNEMTENHKKLRVINAECKWYPACPMKRYFEQGRLDKKWVELYCKGDWKSCVRFEMEEKGIAHSDWMLPDGKIDERLK